MKKRTSKLAQSFFPVFPTGPTPAQISISVHKNCSPRDLCIMNLATTKQVDLPGNDCKDPSIELPAVRCRLVRSLHFSILIDSGKKTVRKKKVQNEQDDCNIL